MNQVPSYVRLIEALKWAEAVVGADWAGPDGPGPALLPRLQSRLNIALMAEEADGVSATAPILSDPFTVPITWSDFEGDVRIAAVKLAIRRTRQSVVEVREQVQSESAPSNDKLLETMQNAYDRSVPLIEGLMADGATLDQVEREKLADLLGNAYGILAWGYGLFDFTNCAELFDLIVNLESEIPNVPGLCDGLTFALLPLMPDKDSDEDDRALARERIKVFVGVFDRATGDDNASWQVNSTGCLADLTQHMSEDEAVRAALKASGRVFDWSASAWIEMNAAYAIHHVLEALHRVRSKDEAALDTRLQEVLETYRSKASSKLRHELVGSIASMLTRPGITVPVRDLLVAELCGFLESARDAEMIGMAVPNLTGAGGRIGADGLRQMWHSVRKASPQVRQFWLSALANSPPELIERGDAEEHLRHLCEIRPMANDSDVPLWTAALTSVGVALVARSAAGPLRDAIAELAADPSCPMSHWLNAAGIAVLGAGREAPDWLLKIRGLTEAAAAEEPINPALRTGLSYFQTVALTESRPISGAEFEARLDLLERVTVFVTAND